MKVYELLVIDAEDTRGPFEYHAQRLFFSTAEKAAEWYTEHFASSNLFWKAKEYDLDSDEPPREVAGNWTRENLLKYFQKTEANQ